MFLAAATEQEWFKNSNCAKKIVCALKSCMRSSPGRATIPSPDSRHFQVIHPRQESLHRHCDRGSIPARAYIGGHDRSFSETIAGHIATV